MKLVLRLALRELINSKKFVLFFVLNLSLGLLGFLVLHGFKTSVNTSLDARARVLLASDISISSRRALKEEEKPKVDEYLETYIKRKSFLNALYSMGQSQTNKRSRLLRMKMITDNFPLYGELSLEKQGVVSSELKKKFYKEKIIWISKELSHQLKLSIGDKLKLGNLNFRVDDIIKKDTTTSSNGISLAPKLYLHYRFQKELGLISRGSVASYTYQYQLNEKGLKNIKKIQKDLLDIIDDPSFRVLTPENSSEQVGRVLNYLSDYLGLVSLVAIFLSTIGAAFLFQDFVFKKIIDIAILKSIGLTTRKILGIFVSQLFILGLISVLVSGIIGAITLPIGSQFLSDFLSVPVRLSVGLESMTISFFIGLGLSLLICFPIIQKLIFKETHDLFGGEKNLTWNFNKSDILKFSPLIIAIELLSIWQASSILIGTAFTFILILSSILLFAIVPPFLSFISRKFLSSGDSIGKVFNTEFGLSLRFLSRGKIATTLTFLSICIGVMLLSIISQLEVSLNTELLSDAKKKPSLFMFDIQAEQKDDFSKFAKDKDIPLVELTPMVRARISHIDGVEFKREEKEKDYQTREDEQRVRFRNRGINLTYSNNLNYTQTLVEGEPFVGKYSGEGLFEVSLDHRYAKRINAKMGTKLTFDVLGVEFEGVVTSLRKIKWTSFLPNFFITLQEGVVEDAPQTFLGVIGSLNPQRQLEVQDLIVENFPNISIINVTELLEKISSVFASMSLAIKIMAYLCILVGFFVVYAIIQNQLRTKQYDILLLKSFGMNSKSIIKIFIYQFLKVSISATLFGTVLSLVVGNLLSRFFFEGVWTIDFRYFIFILLIMSVMTVFLVLISSSSIYKKPIRSLLE